MSKAKIYRFEVYDPTSGLMKRSLRWATRYAIETIAHGRVLEDSEVEVDEVFIGIDIAGFSEVGFDPGSGFEVDTRH